MTSPLINKPFPDIPAIIRVHTPLGSRNFLVESIHEWAYELITGWNDTDATFVGMWTQDMQTTFDMAVLEVATSRVKLAMTILQLPNAEGGLYSFITTHDFRVWGFTNADMLRGMDEGYYTMEESDEQDDWESIQPEMDFINWNTTSIDDHFKLP